jgi:hypothetical protein
VEASQRVCVSEGGDVRQFNAGLAEPHGATRTTTKLQGNRAEISSRLAGESRVSFALLRDQKFQAPIFARKLTCTVAQRKFVETQADPTKLKGTPAVNSSLLGESRVSFALYNNLV